MRTKKRKDKALPSVVVEAQMYEEVRALASAAGESMSEVIRRSLEFFLRRERKKFEAATQKNQVSE